MVRSTLAQTYILRERRLDVLGEKSHGGIPVVSLPLFHSFCLANVSNDSGACCLLGENLNFNQDPHFFHSHIKIHGTASLD